MSTEITNKYHCTQAELYAICYLGWNILKPVQADVVTRYPWYTTTYIDAKITDIKKAEELPDEQARDLATETAHILLAQVMENAVTQWRLLERYISQVFEANPELIKPNVEAAGKQYLATATDDNPNWEDIKHLLIDGLNYITEHTTELTPVMPASFTADYTAAKDAFETQYTEFITNKAGSPTGTYQKVNANNDIYDALLLMLTDMKVLAPAVFQDELTFAYLKNIISSPGPAGLKGEVTDSVTKAPIADAVCELLDTEYGATTNSAGEYNFGNIASGNYTIRISRTGYQTFTGTVKIFTGVTSTKDYTLTPNP